MTTSPSQLRTSSFRSLEQRASASFTWDSLLFSVVSFVTLFARFRSQALLLGSYQDDFFYYLKVAENIALTGVSTFDGAHLTNGYHPLWMCVLVCLRLLFHGTMFFAALQTVSLIAAACTYVLLSRVLKHSLGSVRARAGAFAIGMEALMLIRYGMEVTLTLPLALLLIWLLLRDGVPQTFGRAARMGFVASLMVLSRLDSAILLALLVLAALLAVRNSGLNGVCLAGFACGVLPLLALYAFTNVHYFHLLAPVSGLAKQTRLSHMPSAEAWKSLLPGDRMRSVLLLPELSLVMLSVPLLFVRDRVSDLSLWTRTLLGAVLAFPFIHVFALSILSDWQIWPWYFYSITLAAVAGYTLFAKHLPLRATAMLTSAYGCVLVLYAIVYAVKGPNSMSIFDSSQEVASYMDAHPGIYLMGDQAGTTAYLSHQPVIQAEGLVMDSGFLMHMRHGDPLRDVAADYHSR